MSTHLILIRHGETAWNREKVFRGTHDVPLNEKGREQARLAARALAGSTIDAAYSSPLSRATETAALILEPHDMEAQSHDGLIDFDYGDWTGQADTRVSEKWPEEHARWHVEPHALRVPGGETLQEAFDRSFQAMEEIAGRHDGQTVALVAHRVINKLLLLGALNVGLDRFPQIIQSNSCITRLERMDSTYMVHTINDTAHLRQAGVDVLSEDF